MMVCLTKSDERKGVVVHPRVFGPLHKDINSVINLFAFYINSTLVNENVAPLLVSLESHNPFIDSQFAAALTQKFDFQTISEASAQATLLQSPKSDTKPSEAVLAPLPDPPVEKLPQKHSCCIIC